MDDRFMIRSLATMSYAFGEVRKNKRRKNLFYTLMNSPNTYDYIL